MCNELAKETDLEIPRKPQPCPIDSRSEAKAGEGNGDRGFSKSKGQTRQTALLLSCPSRTNFSPTFSPTRSACSQ